MPRGPKGEKRPADVIGAAIMVGRIATGEIEDATPPPDDGKDPAAVALRRKVAPAMAAGVTYKLWNMEDIVGLIDARDERKRA